MKFEEINSENERILISKNCRNDQNDEYTVKCSNPSIKSTRQAKPSSSKSTPASNKTSSAAASSNNNLFKPAESKQNSSVKTKTFETGRNDLFDKKSKIEFDDNAVWSKEEIEEGKCGFEAAVMTIEEKYTELLCLRAKTKDTKWSFVSGKGIWLPIAVDNT